MTPDAFVAKMLAQIRREFFRKLTDKKFFQEAPFLKQAITFPAKHMEERYNAALPLEKYRDIINTVIEAIRSKGSRKIGRFSVYFLHCVQERMLHHGEEYYQASKLAIPVRDLLPSTMQGIKATTPRDATIALAEAHRVLSARSRRQKSERTQLRLI